MPTHRFTLTLADVAILTPEIGDAIERAGCDDATASSRAGVVSVRFARQAPTLGQAIDAAVEDVRRAGYQVATIEVRELVGSR